MAGYLYDISGRTISESHNIIGESLPVAYDYLGNEIVIDTPRFLETAILTAFPSFTENGPKQGLCTDGTYIYIAGSTSMSYTYGKMIKYDISQGTYEVKQYESSVPFNHGNDLAYDPNNGRIYVATMTTDGGVVVVNSANLNYVKTIYLKNDAGNAYPVRQIAFNRDNKHFYASSDENTVYEYTQNFEYIGKVTHPTLPEATHQSFETDGRFLYRVIYNPNFVIVSTLTGESVASINIDFSGEPESVAYNWENGEFYMNTPQNSDFLYRIQLYETS